MRARLAGILTAAILWVGGVPAPAQQPDPTPDMAAAAEWREQFDAGKARLAEGDLEGARAALERARQASYAFELTDPRFVSTAQYLAEVERRRGRVDRAEDLLRQTLGASRMLEGEHDDGVAAQRVVLARFYESRGRFTDAAREHEAIYRQKRETEKTRGEIVAAGFEWARASLRARDRETALKVLEEIREAIEAEWGTEPARLARYFQVLAQAQLDEKQFEQARNHFERAAELLEGLEEPDEKLVETVDHGRRLAEQLLRRVEAGEQPAAILIPTPAPPTRPETGFDQYGTFEDFLRAIESGDPTRPPPELTPQQRDQVNRVLERWQRHFGERAQALEPGDFRFSQPREYWVLQDRWTNSWRRPEATYTPLDVEDNFFANLPGGSVVEILSLHGSLQEWREVHVHPMTAGSRSFKAWLDAGEVRTAAPLPPEMVDEFRNAKRVMGV